MFDLGLTELLFIVAIAVLVVPAKDLPGLMRSVGRGFGKLRRVARDFQRELDDAVRVDGLADVERRVFEIRWQTETDFAEDLSIVAGSNASEGPRDMEPNPVAQNAAPSTTAPVWQSRRSPMRGQSAQVDSNTSDMAAGMARLSSPAAK